MPWATLLAQATARLQRGGGGSSRTRTLQWPRAAASRTARPEARQMVRALRWRDTLPSPADATEACAARGQGHLERFWSTR
jgi:hypothetical protein